jgi:two-component system, cell cycle sensor histidine kinase and response regulator CckA
MCWAAIPGACSAMPPVSQTSPKEDQNYAGSARRILLLEDDEMLKNAVREYLEMNHYDVVAVSNGAEGVRAVLKQEFDAIVCDMMMPKLPGDMFYTAIERMRPHLCRKFIFITGHRGNPKINDFIKQVRGAMLTKPFRMDDLIEAIGLVQVKGAR